MKTLQRSIMSILVHFHITSAAEMGAVACSQLLGVVGARIRCEIRARGLSHSLHSSTSQLNKIKTAPLRTRLDFSRAEALAARAVLNGVSCPFSSRASWRLSW